MDYKTKSHKRTIITFIALAVVGLICSILALLIKEPVVKVLTLCVSIILLIASLFKLLLELKYSLEINEEEQTFTVKSLFKVKSVSVDDIKKIEQSITEYTFYLDNNEKFTSCDVDLKNIFNVIEYFKTKGLEVKVVQCQ